LVQDDPNGTEMVQTIQKELEVMRVKDKEYDKQVQKKMQGFLLKQNE